MSYYCKLCKICVDQGKPSFEDAHMYVYIIYIYIWMYVFVVLKVNSFLANLCSIPPRKCNMSLQQIPMVVLLQQSVPPIYATCFSKKYSMKLRSLSRTWPNISKLEHTVLILKTQYVHSCSGETIGSCKLERMKPPNGQCTKGANGWKWPKPKKPWNDQTKTIFRESWLAPPLQRV